MANFDHLIDLAAEALGGKALHASDEFFAPKENLLKPGRGEFIVGKYTPYGKWMDGWESRRKRVPGYDWCIIKLGLPGKIRGIDVDTNHFTGNFPEFASLDAIEAPADSTHESLRDAKWTSLVPISKLQGGSRNLFAVHSEARFTHVRLNIHPDGGVARLRVHGVVLPDWPNAGTDNGHFNLSALENGAVVVAANDMFFGHMNNLIMPGDPATMGDGWETRRKRGPGNDWIVVKLAEPGYVRRVIVDTMHFKGNYPEGFSLEGAVLPDDTPTEYFSSRAVQWVEILGLTRLHPDTCHDFRHGLNAVETVFTHVRLSIFPDGGVARLRVLGTLPWQDPDSIIVKSDEELAAIAEAEREKAKLEAAKKAEEAAALAAANPAAAPQAASAPAAQTAAAPAAPSGPPMIPTNAPASEAKHDASTAESAAAIQDLLARATGAAPAKAPEAPADPSKKAP